MIDDCQKSEYGHLHFHKTIHRIYRPWTDIVSSVSANIGRSTTVIDLISVDQLGLLSGFP